jgi:three-Cys-motif partner protein
VKDLPNVGDDGLFIEPDVGTWSEEKYRLVSLYASMFTKAMRSKFGSLVYVDMFSGPGRVQIKHTTRIYDSSPINALAIEPQFDRLIFCEQSEERMDALKARCNKLHPHRDVRFVLGDVNANAAEILQHVPKHRKGHGVLTLCFVDPYKMANLRFKTLENFQELWLDFLVLIPSEMDAERGKHTYVGDDNVTVGEFVGNPEWRSVWDDYVKRGVRFEQFVVEEFGRSMTRLGRIDPGLSKTHVMKNTVNRQLYRLALYSRSEVAGKFWAQAQKYATPHRDLFS